MNTLLWLIIVFSAFMLGRITALKPKWTRKHTIFAVVVTVLTILQIIFVHDIEKLF